MSQCPRSINPNLGQYSTYPCEYDSSATLPLSIDKVTNINAEVVNRLRSSILSIENELGILPSGVYSTTRARLDDLDARISAIIESIANLDLATILERGNTTGGRSIIFTSGSGLQSDSGTLPLTGNLNASGTLTSQATVYTTIGAGYNNSLWVRSSDNHLIYTNNLGTDKDISALTPGGGGGGGGSQTWAGTLALGNSSDGYNVNINNSSVFTVNASTARVTNSGQLNLLSSSTLNVSGNAQINVASGSAYNASSGNLVFNGSSAGDKIVFNLTAPSPAVKVVEYQVGGTAIGTIGLLAGSAMLIQPNINTPLLGLGYITTGNFNGVAPGINIVGANSSGSLSGHHGGDIDISAGASVANSSRAGNASLNGGTNNTGTSGIGGSASVIAGNATQGTGGAATLQSGAGVTGGAVTVLGKGNGNASTSGTVTISTENAGNAGDVIIAGGNSALFNATPKGGVYISAGSGSALAALVNGASIYLTPGAGVNSGVPGVVEITGPGAALNINALSARPSTPGVNEGFWWTKTGSPTLPYFTDSAGVDHNLLASTGGGGSTFDGYLDGYIRVVMTPTTITLPVGTRSVSANNGGITINMNANPQQGNMVWVKDANGNATASPITISGNGKLIDGASTYSLDTNYHGITLIYNGVKWMLH